MGKSAAKLPPMPPGLLASVTDPNLRALLQAVVDGWQMRNGMRGGTKETEFLTIEDIAGDPELKAKLKKALGL